MIRTVTFAPELPGSIWLTEQLAYGGSSRSSGTQRPTWEQARAAILAGARHVTHLYDAILGYKENPREALVMMPGMETAVLYERQRERRAHRLSRARSDAFFAFIDKVKPAGKKVIVTDSLVGTGQPEGTVSPTRTGTRSTSSGESCG